MKLMTPSAMHALDEAAIKEYGIPGILLMEHAAYHLFKHLQGRDKAESVVIVCGPGNNGGDGLALARQLFSWGQSKVKVLLLAPREKLSEDGRTYFDVCQKLQVDMMEVDKQNRDTAFKSLEAAKVIVDALFGTGLTRPVEGLYAEMIDHMNQSTAYKLSVDIPSGLDGNTGKVQGIGVMADYTITFVLPKKGLYQYPAPLYTGVVEVVDIGMPKALVEAAQADTFSIEEEEMKVLLPRRAMRSNKGSFGKVLVIGGSQGMSGAPALTSMAAYKVGSGTVTAAVPYAILEIMEQKLTEVIHCGLPDEDGFFSKEAEKIIGAMLDRYDVIAIGPGLGRNRSVLPVLIDVLISDKPCVIDADALYFIPELTDLLRIRKAPTIITPHPGEMARLTGLTIAEILEQPLEIAKKVAQDLQVITVLKLERTVIADPNGDTYINRYGNSGLAKGGSGDVLTGIITGLLTQSLKAGLPAMAAAKLGCFLHAKAGDEAAKDLTEYSFLPSDTIHYLSQVLKALI